MAENARTASIERKTKETEIHLSLNLDRPGPSRIETGVGFFDHMLDLFARHAGFALEVQAEGDTWVDDHHTVEDVGICLGQALARALGDMGGIQRFASIALPMQEALARVAVDLCGRAFLIYNVKNSADKVGTFDSQLALDFFEALTANGKFTLHVNLEYGTNQHHILEAVFKGVGRALGAASRVVGDPGEVPSTKGTL